MADLGRSTELNANVGTLIPLIDVLLVVLSFLIWMAVTPAPAPPAPRPLPSALPLSAPKQMLAMARILRSGASVLLLDEITEGLAPVIVDRLAEILESLKKRGLTILLVEQNFHFAAPIADRHYVMEHGQIIEEVTREALPSKKAMLNELLGV